MELLESATSDLNLSPVAGAALTLSCPAVKAESALVHTDDRR